MGRCAAVRDFADGATESADATLEFAYEGDDATIGLSSQRMNPGDSVTIWWGPANAVELDLRDKAERVIRSWDAHERGQGRAPIIDCA